MIENLREQPRSDEELMRSFYEESAGIGRAAIEVLYYRHRSAVRRIFTTMNIPTHELFDFEQKWIEKLLATKERQSGKYDVEQGPWQAWAYRIARNLAIDFHRRRQPHNGQLSLSSRRLDDEAVTLESALPDHQPEIWETAARKELADNVRRAVGLLEREEAIVAEAYLNSCGTIKTHELAELLDVNISKAYRIYRRMLASIAERLRDPPEISRRRPPARSRQFTCYRLPIARFYSPMVS